MIWIRGESGRKIANLFFWWETENSKKGPSTISDNPKIESLGKKEKSDFRPDQWQKRSPWRTLKECLPCQSTESCAASSCHGNQGQRNSWSEELATTTRPHDFQPSRAHPRGGAQELGEAYKVGSHCQEAEEVQGRRISQRVASLKKAGFTRTPTHSMEVCVCYMHNKT